METVRKIRKPAVAGQFYDSIPGRLSASLDKIFSDARALLADGQGRSARALIVPHAGYPYSGLTAGKAFLRAEKGHFKRVLVIAPSHRVAFNGLAVSSSTVFQTPLGELSVDVDAVNHIISSGGAKIGILDSAHQYEHALEVELPFIQKIFGNLLLLPFVCGSITDSDASKIADALYPFWEPETLWVISSDFTHYGEAFQYLPFTRDIAENLRKLDGGAIELIMKLDVSGFSNYLEATGATICGGNPIKILLSVLAKLSGAGEKIISESLDYTSSGALTGDYSHCVSYAGIAFYSEK